MLGRRAMTAQQLAAKLQDKGYGDDEIQETLALFQSYGYLNDREYALEFARTRAARGQGAYRIGRELRERGVDAEIVEQTLETLDDPRQAIDKLLHAKLNGQNDEKARRRAAAFLARRGYAYHDIENALGEWED